MVHIHTKLVILPPKKWFSLHSEEVKKETSKQTNNIIIDVVVLAQYPELEEVEQKECRKRNLEYGQSYYIFRDNRHDSNATDVLKGSGKIYKGKIHTYVEFFIVGRKSLFLYTIWY